MNQFSLNTKIPCENCANSIKSILSSIPGVERVDCSIEDSQVIVKTELQSDLSSLRRICIEQLTKTGRQVN